MKGSGFRAVFAALAAGLLMTTYLLPAYADVADTAVNAIASVEETQSIAAMSDGNSSTGITRDEYTVTRFVPDEHQPFSRTAATFVNDPHSPIQWPFSKGVPIITGFGPRVAPCEICSTFHKGLDMIPGAGTPIQAIADGVVSAVNTISWELGIHVKIDHVVDGERVSSLYAHMQEGTETVVVGQHVTVGQLIGLVGNTGLSMGPHLHFEILLGGTQPTDPFAWLSDRVGKR